MKKCSAIAVTFLFAISVTVGAFGAQKPAEMQTPAKSGPVVGESKPDQAPIIEKQGTDSKKKATSTKKKKKTTKKTKKTKKAKKTKKTKKTNKKKEASKQQNAL